MADGIEHAGGGGSGGEAALGGELVDDAIGEGVTEGDAEFEDIDAGLVEGEGELAGGIEVGVTGADIDDEGFLVIFLQLFESCLDAVHGGASVRIRLRVCNRVIGIWGGRLAWVSCGGYGWVHENWLAARFASGCGWIGGIGGCGWGFGGWILGWF